MFRFRPQFRPKFRFRFRPKLKIGVSVDQSVLDSHVRNIPSPTIGMLSLGRFKIAKLNIGNLIMPNFLYLQVEEEKMRNDLEEAEKLKDATDLKPEDAISTPAPLYRQLLNAHAEEAAVHDAIYYLGEALKHEVIDCDVFLKQVRKMARRQFFLKATMEKCRKVAGLPA